MLNQSLKDKSFAEILNGADVKVPTPKQAGIGTAISMIPEMISLVGNLASSDGMSSTSGVMNDPMGTDTERKNAAAAQQSKKATSATTGTLSTIASIAASILIACL